MIFITTAPLGRDPGCVALSRKFNGRHRADKNVVCQRQWVFTSPFQLIRPAQ